MFLGSKKFGLSPPTGTIPVQFEFIRILDDKSNCKVWLMVEPLMGIMMLGNTLYIKLEAFMGKKTGNDFLGRSSCMISMYFIWRGQGNFCSVLGVFGGLLLALVSD